MDTFSILIFNVGKCSLKFTLLDRRAADSVKFMVEGCISDIGGKSSFSWTCGSVHAYIPVEISTHEEAAEWVLDWLQSLWPFGSLLSNLGLVAHQFDDGGKHFCAPVIVTEEVMSRLDELTPFATQHNAKVLGVLRTSRKIMTKNVLTIATFLSTALCH